MKTYRTLAAVILILWMVVAPGFADPALTGQTHQKVAELLTQCGFQVEKVSATGWKLTWQPHRTMLVVTTSDMVIVGAPLAHKMTEATPPATLIKLLRASDDNDFVKIGLDRDNEVFVRTETPVHSLDVDTLKDMINQVGNVSTKLVDTLDASSFPTH